MIDASGTPVANEAEELLEDLAFAGIVFISGTHPPKGWTPQREFEA